MSSAGRFPHRCRSHSASSESPTRGLNISDDPKWRFAIKRARRNDALNSYHRNLPMSDEPPEKWDVDLWRRGKRARTDTASRDGCDDEGFIVLSQDISLERATKSPSMPPLPCTSDAFQLFPPHIRKKQRRTSHGATSLSAQVTHDEELKSSEELDRLRSDAFGELHRSVAESGEGLVSRMRDWESSRLRPSVGPSAFSPRGSHPHWRRRRSMQTSRGPFAAESAVRTTADDDEDVEIVSGDMTSGSAHSPIRSPSHKKRALSLGMMDVDPPEITIHTSYSADGSERCSSPVDASAGVYTYSSDDESSDSLSPHAGPSATPALTHTYSNSANSSMISLPLSMLSQPQPGEAFAFVPAAQPTKAPHVPSSASRSEKALAALTLAMANGAGGISDYAPLRFVEDASTIESVLDERHVGELWH